MMDGRIARFFFNHSVYDLLLSGEAETVPSGILDTSMVGMPHRLLCLFIQFQVVVGISGYAVRLEQNMKMTQVAARWRGASADFPIPIAVLEGLQRYFWRNLCVHSMTHLEDPLCLGIICQVRDIDGGVQ